MDVRPCFNGRFRIKENMMNRKVTLTPEKAENLFMSMQAMATIVQLLDIEYEWHLKDARFQSPIINNHKKRIRESIEALKLETLSKITPKDREYFVFDHCTNVFEILRFLMFMPKEGLEDTLKQIEELKKQAVA